MTGATDLQEQRGAIRARRLLAMVTAVWFVACGVLGAQHEAQVTHAVDPTTGQIVHADFILGHHASDTPDIHSAEPDTDRGVCALSAALHQAAHPVQARLTVAACDATIAAVSRHALSTSVIATIYLIAPKTSPPALV